MGGTPIISVIRVVPHYLCPLWGNHIVLCGVITLSLIFGHPHPLYHLLSTCIMSVVWACAKCYRIILEFNPQDSFIGEGAVSAILKMQNRLDNLLLSQNCMASKNRLV